MSIPREKDRSLAELEEAIKRGIVERTGSRIQELEVEVTDARIEIRGRTVSFYIKQLAIQGALDVVGPAGARPIEVKVQVERKAHESRPKPR
jgi:hypothetical protein